MSMGVVDDEGQPTVLTTLPDLSTTAIVCAIAAAMAVWVMGLGSLCMIKFLYLGTCEDAVA
jgi:hypothetical protein